MSITLTPSSNFVVRCRFDKKILFRVHEPRSDHSPVGGQGQVAEAGVGRQLPDRKLDEEVAVEPEVRQVLEALERVLLDRDQL
jgi:hypothetical protein